MTWILVIGFIFLLVMRVPIIMAMGTAVLATVVAAGFTSELYILPRHVADGVDNASLLAVPFFIMAGNLMNAVGMTDKIFNFATLLVGHFRAGLAQVNVLASMIFAGISGSAVADIAGLGTVEVKAMKDRGYPVEFAGALTVATAVIGPIIPPSISLVIYGFLADTSVGRLFLGGVIPGILIGLSLMLWNRYLATRHDFPREPRASLRDIGSHAIDGVAALVAPGIILGAIVTGYTTATEAGVLACAYSLLLGAFYRSLNIQKLVKAMTDTTKVTAMIMMIVGFSHVMGWLLAIEQIPQAMAEAVLLTTTDRNVFLLLMIFFLLAIGCVVEGVPAKLILIPILIPIVDQFGIDRVHFGLIIVYALLLGLATPPMGVGIYIMVGITKKPFEVITMAFLPFMVPLVIVLFMITYIPQLTLWLPNLIMGPY
ncbi:MAG: TRAP transporter large permease [Rhodospirillales bacterium]|jgi:tripartite ATP-independent transporter DctM subunit|nr:TRAP transporter large permease [Rhodospirillales bacterium]